MQSTTLKLAAATACALAAATAIAAGQGLRNEEPVNTVAVAANTAQFGGGGFGGSGGGLGGGAGSVDGLSNTSEPRPVGMDDPKSLEILDVLEKPISLPFETDTPIADVLKYVVENSKTPELPNGVPVYLDPLGLSDVEATDQSAVRINLEGVSLKRGLYLALRPLQLSYTVQDGLLIISTKDRLNEILFDNPVYQGKQPVEANGIMQAGAFQ